MEKSCNISSDLAQQLAHPVPAAGIDLAPLVEGSRSCVAVHCGCEVVYLCSCVLVKMVQTMSLSALLLSYSVGSSPVFELFFRR